MGLCDPPVIKNQSLQNSTGYSPDEVVTLELIAWGISGGFTALACLFSLALIYMHLRYWSKPGEQRYIVRLLVMVPIYAIDSWLSLRFKEYALYFDIFRDCYEAYVIYQFFCLLISYIAGGDNDVLFKILDEKPHVKFPIPLCCLKPVKPSQLYYTVTRQCILQYVVIKPVMSIVAAVLEATGNYQSGNFCPLYGYVYCTVITFASVTISMYFLVWFYFTMEKDLEKHSPVSKFICIKAILFFSFWQEVLIAILSFFSVIPENEGNWTQDNISVGLQDFIICVEMCLLSIIHGWVFTYTPYQIKDPEDETPDQVFYGMRPVKNFAKDVVNQKDVVKDMKNAYNPKKVKAAHKAHKETKKKFAANLKVQGSHIEGTIIEGAIIEGEIIEGAIIEGEIIVDAPATTEAVSDV